MELFSIPFISNTITAIPIPTHNIKKNIAVAGILRLARFLSSSLHVRRKLKKLNTVYLWVAIILTDNPLPFLFSETINIAVN